MNPRILVIRGGAIGDFILTLPAIQLLRRELPDAHIEILGYPAVTELARDTGIADDVRSIEYAGLANFFNPNTILDPDLMTYFEGFSLVLSYLYDPDGYFLGNLARSGAKTCIPCSHRVDESGPPAAAQLAKPLEQLALFLEDRGPCLSYPDSILDSAAAFLGKFPPGPAPIAIHPGSGSPKKNWPVDHWIELCEELHRGHPDRPFVLVSGEADDANTGALLQHWNRRAIRYAHAWQLELSTVGAILSRCAVFLGHDSGISHLAAASGVPCLLLFGPTNPEVWAPQNKQVRVLTSGTSDLSGISPARMKAETARFF